MCLLLTLALAFLSPSTLPSLPSLFFSFSSSNPFNSPSSHLLSPFSAAEPSLLLSIPRSPAQLVVLYALVLESKSFEYFLNSSIKMPILFHLIKLLTSVTIFHHVVVLRQCEITKLEHFNHFSHKTVVFSGTCGLISFPSSFYFSHFPAFCNLSFSSRLDCCSNLEAPSDVVAWSEEKEGQGKEKGRRRSRDRR